MLVLDTDLLTLILFQTSEVSERLRARLGIASNRDAVCVTIISLEEQMRGWLSFVTKTKTVEQQVEAYRRLHQLFRDYQDRQILDFDDRAAQQFQVLRKQKIRIGTMDLKIAAIALANDAVLLSRNLRDYQKVPGLKVEDWTRAES